MTCGLLWEIGLFRLTWWAILLDGATGEATLLGRIYRGYSISPLGSAIGPAWAPVEGFVGAVVFAWLYNRLASRRSKEERG